MESIINIAELTQAISEEQPSGIDLRADASPSSLYYQLKDARNAARGIERANMGKAEDDQETNPHWKKIIALAPQALMNSKDLEVAAWLTEALVREYGFSGLQQGLQLLTELISHFDTLYPLPDEDGIETTLMPITGLNGTGAPGTLISPINCIAITDSAKGEKFSTWQYQQSTDLARAPNEKARQERLRSGVMKMETLIAAANSTPKAFYETLMAELDSASNQYSTLTKLLADKFGHDAPPSTNIRNALNKARKAIKTIAKDVLPSNMPIADADETSTDMPVGMMPDVGSMESANLTMGAAPILNTSATLQNRKAAFDTLKGLAEFFKRTEPHSPVGYMLERVIRWGDMALPELMKQLLTEHHAQQEFYKMAGVEPPVEPALQPPPMPGYSGHNSGMPMNNYGGGYQPPPMMPDPYGSSMHDPYGPPPPPNF